MQANDIQRVVIGTLTIVGGQRLHSTEVSLSDEPDDPQGRKTVDKPSYVCGAIMTKSDFFKFRGLCNALGVWVRVQHFWPVSERFHERDDDKFEYSLYCTEMWGGGVIRAAWPILLTVGITASYLLWNGYIRL